MSELPSERPASQRTLKSALTCAIGWSVFAAVNDPVGAAVPTTFYGTELTATVLPHCSPYFATLYNANVGAVTYPISAAVGATEPKPCLAADSPAVHGTEQTTKVFS